MEESGREKHLLQCPDLGPSRSRRKSPVTVQEWVAHLPWPINNDENNNEKNKEIKKENKDNDKYENNKEIELDSNLAKEKDKQDSCTKETHDGSNESRPQTSQESSSFELVETKEKKHGNNNNFGSKSSLQERRFEHYVEDDNKRSNEDLNKSNNEDKKSDNIANEIKNDQNADKSVKNEQNSSKIASTSNNKENDENKSNDKNDREDTKIEENNAENKRKNFGRGRETRISLQSDLSVSSLDSVLNSREVDPAELLLDLGFGGGEAKDDLITRIPSRFFQKSHARGISVEAFLQRQTDIMERCDSGSNGYRGLIASSSDKAPSELVSKIIDRLRSPTGLSRQMSQLSSWPSSVSLLSSAPSEPRPSFASIVQQRVLRANLRGAKAFRATANSVLSPANQKFMREQEEQRSRSVERRLVLGNQTFSVQEDHSLLPLNVIEEEHEESNADQEDNASVDSFANRKMSRTRSISKRDSALSLNSSCSVESDWSEDEEMEQLERILVDIQDRSDAVEEDKSRRLAARKRWQHLRKSTKQAMKRISQNEDSKDNSNPKMTATASSTPTSVRESLWPSDGRIPRRFSRASSSETKRNELHKLRM